MKKLFTLILAVALATPTFAQFNSHRTTRNRFNHNDTERYYGLRLGLNISSLSSDVNFDMNTRTGLAFGGVFGFQLVNSQPIYLETGLFYSEKGGETHWVDNMNNSQEVRCRLSYLQLPIVGKYSFNVYDDLFIQPFLGGYLSVGIAGRFKEYGYDNVPDSRKAYSSYDWFNRFDGGLRIGCGVEYKIVYAELGFDFGLANISKGDFDATRTRNFFMNVGVNF